MRLYIGFITYEESTAKYLPYFLSSLRNQSGADYRVLAVDNSLRPDNENCRYLRNNFPEIELIRPGKNLGFAKAFNTMIRRAMEWGADYFLALNPDMILEENFITELVKATAADKRIGAVAPKILKWDFVNNKKTRQIDSLGLTLTKEHRFFDARQGETDEPAEESGQREVFGFTGAAVLLNLPALTEVAFDNGAAKEYFDELMFMYKEDCDLSYRLRLAGWKIVLAPAAVAYHNRAVAGVGQNSLAIALNRKNKSRQVKEWSFLNQGILLCKLKNLPFSRRVKAATAWYQFKSLVFAILFERFLLKQLAQLWRLRPKVKARREQLKIAVEIKEIEKFMLSF